jgi:hypothetical protein
MDNLQEKIINIQTNEITYRDYTPEEMAEIETAKQLREAEIADLAIKEAARAALLDKLGITADEAKLLLG